MLNKKEELLSEIHDYLLKDMLEDLKNPDKRTPQLYNAIIKELERNGIDCIPKAGEDQQNALQSLLEGVKSAYEEDVAYYGGERSN